MASTETLPSGVKLRDFEDFDSAREDIFSSAKAAFGKAFPISYGGLKTHVEDLEYTDPETYDKAAQKDALMKDQRLGRRLRGTVVLTDEATGMEMERKKMTLMKVPYLTERGTLIRDGTEYVHINQLRLLPGPYSRVKQNGELETQFNVRPGTGTNFRVMFKPEDSQYKLNVAQSELHLYSLLKDLGVSDDSLKQKWGESVFNSNSARYDGKVLDKAYERLVPKWSRQTEGEVTREQKQEAVKQALNESQLNARVARRNLPGSMHYKSASVEPAPSLPEIAPPPPLIKLSAVQEDKLIEIAQFLNRDNQAGLDLNAPAAQLESAIIEFLMQHAEVDEQALLQAAGRRDKVGEVPEDAAPEPTVPIEKQAALKIKDSCLLLRLPLAVSAMLVRWAESNLPAGSVIEFEYAPHVTIAEGISPDVSVDDIRAALAGWAGENIDLRLQRMSLFSGEDQDVVKLDVDSPDLRDLYRFLRKFLGKQLGVKYPAYVPHVTLAYVQPGSADALQENATFYGIVATGKTVIFSQNNRALQTSITLDEAP
jgi:2'-5' RNA ligase